MTQTPETPQEGIADALGTLSEQTRVLVRQEIEAARQEMWDKGKAAVPALALSAVAATLGLFAAAASYRLGLRLLERRMPPGAAALAAMMLYGGGAAAAAVAGARRWRELPPLFPTRTARQAGAALAEAAPQQGG
jgi:Putative Actinobacterial Holin-X, holin superfamily III